MRSDTRVIETEFARVSIVCPKSDLVLHAHRHAHVVVPLDPQGQDEIHIDSRWQLLDPSSIHLINPLEVHGFHSASPRADPSYLLMYIQPEWLAREHGLSIGKPFAHRKVKLTEDVRRQALAFADAMLCGYELDDLLDLEIKQFMDVTVRRASADHSQTKPGIRGQQAASDWRIRKAMSYMEEHLEARWSLGEVAREAGISRPHFFNLFIKQVGVTPRLYCNALRIEKALDEMRNPSIHLGNLAYELGFSSQGNFSRFFREHVGVSPLTYRQSHH